MPTACTPLDPRDAFAELGRTRLQDVTSAELLQKIADLCKRVLPAGVEVSVTLLDNDRAHSAVHTGQLAVDLDESQYGRGYGPCLEAAAAGQVVEVVDARTDTRWADYTDVCVRHGALSSLSLPLPVQGHLCGALNIYGRPVGAFRAQPVQELAQQFAAYAAVGLGNLFAYQDIRSRAEGLQRAMDSRAVIEQAKGILVERHRLTPELAFRMLAEVSMNTNGKLRDIAEHLVETGELIGR